VFFFVKNIKNFKRNFSVLRIILKNFNTFINNLNNFYVYFLSKKKTNRRLNNRRLLTGLILSSVLFTQVAGAAQLEIKDGETLDIVGIFQEESDGVAMTGGTLNITGNTNGKGLLKALGSNFTISGGEINLSGYSAENEGELKAENDKNIELNITGGTVNINDYGQVQSDGELDISGGTVNLNGDTGVAVLSSDTKITLDGGVINVLGGKRIS
jgi:hypothetical protein